MKNVIKRLLSLFFALVLYALGVVLTIRANIGYGPWEVFHAGLAKVFGTQIGTMSVLVGVIIGIITLIFGESIGIGSISNMILIGLMLNRFLTWDFFVDVTNPLLGALQMIAGLFVISTATVFYISSGYGAGPRDSLMVLLARKGRLSVGTYRAIIEISVTVIGALMGGMFGWGTILSAVSAGFCIQITFKVFRFDPRTIQHEDIRATYNKIVSLIHQSDAH